MLIDDVIITIKGGRGGNGAVTFHPRRGGPSGGNGGHGGNVFFIGVNDIEALTQFKFKKSVQAQDGEPGGRQDQDGRNAGDLYIKLPVGTRIAINDSGWIYEIKDTQTPFLAAKGGKGGLGNDEFKTPTNQTPRYAEKGEEGQEKIVRLQLRLIAQIGFAGLPNAGKSSLLQALTRANPKIGDYPFTTLEPNLGALNNLILADIPGLIEGASQGKGLGIKFLKHIEKTSVIAHCIDITGGDLLDNYETVRKEFGQYNKELLDKQEIIILTKTDLLDPKETEKKVKLFRKLKKIIVPVSIIDDQSLQILKQILVKQAKSKKNLRRQ